MRLAPLAVALLAVLMMSPVEAQDCFVRSDQVDAVVCAPSPVCGAQLPGVEEQKFYLRDSCRDYPGLCAGDLWVYEETNGLEGLQRFGDVCYPADTFIA